MGAEERTRAHASDEWLGHVPMQVDKQLCGVCFFHTGKTFQLEQSRL